MNSLSVKSVVFIYASKKRLLYLGWVIGAIGVTVKKENLLPLPQEHV